MYSPPALSVPPEVPSWNPPSRLATLEQRGSLRDGLTTQVQPHTQLVNVLNDLASWAGNVYGRVFLFGSAPFVGCISEPTGTPTPNIPLFHRISQCPDRTTSCSTMLPSFNPFTAPYSFVPNSQQPFTKAMCCQQHHAERNAIASSVFVPKIFQQVSNVAREVQHLSFLGHQQRHHRKNFERTVDMVGVDQATVGLIQTACLNTGHNCGSE